jgi:hypothetical protein
MPMSRSEDGMKIAVLYAVAAQWESTRPALNLFYPVSVPWSSERI